MKRKSNKSSMRAYHLTDKGVHFAQENRPIPLNLTEKGEAFVLDHKAKLGAIPESQNLPFREKSHVDYINEEIELFEQTTLSKGDKLKILMDCSDRLHQRWLAAWDAHQALPVNDVRLNATFARLERIHKACKRVTAKINQLLDA